MAKNRKSSITDRFDLDSNIVLYNGKAEKLIQQIPPSSLKLIVTSPPYNLGKDYEEKRPLETYLRLQEKLIANLYDLLTDDGSICWQVGNYIQNGEVYPLDIFYYSIFKKFNFILRNRIIWHFRHGVHSSNRFSGRYETILWFTKSNEFTFNLDAVRIPAKYPGKRYYKGPKKGMPSGNPNGKNPSDVWDVVLNDWEAEIWDIPNVKANHVEKTSHPCQFPVELAERCILALTNENDRVFDPYAGVGSSLIASIKNNRKAIGAEIKSDYIKIAKKRIDAYFDGTLKLRPLGKPVYEPTGQEKVARIPSEWTDVRVSTDVSDTNE